MQIETDITKNNCHFEQCRNYHEGKCLNGKARKDCLEIALAVLCATEKRIPNGCCDFCGDMQLAKSLNEDKCETYNRKDKVGRATARIGVKFMTYMTDAHSRMFEKDSKVYKLNYCPVCGRAIKKWRKGRK